MSCMTHVDASDLTRNVFVKYVHRNGVNVEAGIPGEEAFLKMELDTEEEAKALCADLFWLFVHVVTASVQYGRTKQLTPDG